MLPWYEHARREPNPPAISDCAKCLQNTPRLQRQSLGCGFEPAPPRNIPVRPWDHKGRAPGHDERDEHGVETLLVCPAYVCRLPQVIEVARAHTHWAKGAMSIEWLTEHERTAEALEILEGSHGALQSWAMKPKDQQ
jgi:hypothetical protein